MLKEIRGQVFVWIGIVGGALTLVNHWSNFITLADWMHWLVSHFSDILHMFWSWIGYVFRLDIPRYVADLFSLFLFYASIVLGSVKLANVRMPMKRSYWLILLLFPFLQVVELVLILLLTPYIGEQYQTTVIFVVTWLSVMAVMFYIVRGQLFLKIYTIVLIVDLSELLYHSGAIAETMSYVNSISESTAPIYKISLQIMMLYLVPVAFFLPPMVAPADALAKRLTFMLIGVALIFGLSEASILADKLRTAGSPA